MEEKKEMTFVEELNLLVDDYQEEQRLKQEKAMEERRQKIDYYLKGQCRTYARCGNHRVPIYQEEAAAKTSVDVQLEDIIAFATEIGMNWDPFWGENKIELIWKTGKPEFCEEPFEEHQFPKEDADEPSAESATEAIEKMVAGMSKRPEIWEDDEETEENYSFDTGV